MGQIEVLHSKLSADQAVAKADVVSAKNEFAAMTPDQKLAKRAMLLDIRYRQHTSVAADAKAELEAFQRNLPERDTLEAAKHIGLDAGENAQDVGKDMFNDALKGGQEIAGKVASGDVVGPLTHPMAATLLGVTGMTLLSNWVLGTKNSVLSNIFLFTGVKFVSQMIKKYSK